MTRLRLRRFDKAASFSGYGGSFWPFFNADADRVDLESRLIKLLLEDRACIRFPVTAAPGA
jgi:hypothetical protein